MTRRRIIDEGLDPELVLRVQARLEEYRIRRSQYRPNGNTAFMRDRAGTLAGITVNPLPSGYDHSWRDDAACRGPEHDLDLFFPTRGETDRLRAAKAVCATCPVTEPCLAFALLTGAEGIWGGTSEKQRRAIKRTAGQD